MSAKVGCFSLRPPPIIIITSKQIEMYYKQQQLLKKYIAAFTAFHVCPHFCFITFFFFLLFLIIH